MVMAKLSRVFKTCDDNKSHFLAGKKLNDLRIQKTQKQDLENSNI
jgi:hypothetical protein